MKKETVTSALRQTILAVTGKGLEYGVYSDSRKRKTAVGVKLIRTRFNSDTTDKIVKVMQDKGFKLAYVKYNDMGWRHCPGQRFCFYKK